MAHINQEFCDSLTSANIEQLNGADIWTVNDFVSYDSMFEIKRKTGLKHQIVTEIEKAIGQRYCLKPKDLKIHVDQSVQDCRMCPTGLPELTAALDGGFQTQEIVEFFGDSECGKTELCYLLCGEMLSHFSNYHILYIASDHDFDPEKVAKYAKLKSGARELTDEDIHGFLSRIQIARPTKLSDLVHLVNTIVCTESKSFIRCVIIDSLSFLVQDDVLEIRACDFSDGDELARFSAFKNTSLVHGEANATSENTRNYVIDQYLHEVTKILTNFAMIKNVMIIITTSDQRLAFSKSWTNALDHRILLTKVPEHSCLARENLNATVLNATIIKTTHNISRIGYSIPFMINDEGLFAIRTFAKPHDIPISTNCSKQGGDELKQESCNSACQDDTQK